MLLRSMTEMFVFAGYKPYNSDTKKAMDPDLSYEWGASNVIWVGKGQKWPL